MLRYSIIYGNLKIENYHLTRTSLEINSSFHIFIVYARTKKGNFSQTYIPIYLTFPPKYISLEMF